MSLWIERRHENNTSNIFNHNGKIVGHTQQLAFVFGLFHWSVPNQWWGILPPYLFLNINDAPSLPFKKYTLRTSHNHQLLTKACYENTTNNEGGGSEEFGKEKEVLFTERSWEVSEQEERKVLHHWEMYYYASLCTRVILSSSHTFVRMYI